MFNPKWLEWGQDLQAIAQSGLTFSKNPYDTDRYQKLLKITFEMLSTYSHVEMPVIEGLFQLESGYATPKVSVRAAIFKDNQILMVKELADGGRWTLPGGWADVNDLPSQAIEREVREETGYIVRAVKLLSVFDPRKHDHPPFTFHLYNLFFLCELLGGEPATSMETGISDFFKQDELPDLSLQRVTPGEIQRMFFHLHNPNLPTDFD